MADSVIQTSFASGEISPNLFARVDLDKYRSGAQLLRNFFVDYRGGASTRPGTELIERTRYPERKARLIPFVFSQDLSYVLEFGHLYIRFFSNGEALIEAGTPITAITQGNPGIVESSFHGLSTGDDVYISGIVGMTELNGRTFRVQVLDGAYFTLWDWDGNPIDTSGYHAYISGGTVQRVYTVPTPYVEEDLALLKFVQSADVMTITHGTYVPHELKRMSASSFVLDPFPVGPALPAPANVITTVMLGGVHRYGYCVVALTAGGEKGFVSATATGDSAPLDQTSNPPVNIEVSWDPVPGADHYHVYKWGPVSSTLAEPTFFGFIGQTFSTAFTDNNIGPDFTSGPPQFRFPFSGGNNPTTVSYFQQRLAFAGFVFAPQEIDFSQTGAYHNFDVSLTVNDSDAISIALASRQVNTIKSMVSVASGLVVLTSGGAFQLSGGSPQAAITPTNITALPQASTGANDMPPIVVNYDILFVQAKGAIVRDLAFNFYLQTFYGFDRSALSNHLFFGRQLVEWAYAEEPFKIIWVTRDDGRALSFTYVPEQEVYAWAQHDTQGAFESVCSVPEGQEDAVYFIARRAYNGPFRVRYIERLASRKFIRVEDTFCLDSAVKRQLARPGFEVTVSANPETAFLQSEPGFYFDASWLGQIIWFDVGGKMQVTEVSSINQLVAKILQPLGNQLPNDPTRYHPIKRGEWEVATLVTEVSGLDHLKGQLIWVVSDGSAYGPLMCPPDGIVELPEPATKVMGGLSYTAQLQTLKLDVGDPTIQGRQKKISAVTLFVDQSRGLKAGENFSTLRIVKEQPASAYTPPLGLFSTEERVVLASSWNVDGQFCVQQDQPFPSTVLGVVPEVTVGDTAK